MTVRLSIQRRAWELHVHEYAASVPGLVPVVKGNGYGFGRSVLHPVAAALANRVAVGSIYELDDIADGVTPIVLTPSLVAPPQPSSPTDPLNRLVPTVGSVTHVAALAGWHGSVAVELRTSMRRHGVSRYRDSWRATAAITRAATTSDDSPGSVPASSTLTRRSNRSSSGAESRRA